MIDHHIGKGAQVLGRHVIKLAHQMINRLRLRRLGLAARPPQPGGLLGPDQSFAHQRPARFTAGVVFAFIHRPSPFSMPLGYPQA